MLACVSHSQSLQTGEAFKMQAMSRSSQTAMENESLWLFTDLCLERILGRVWGQICVSNES